MKARPCGFVWADKWNHVSPGVWLPAYFPQSFWFSRSRLASFFDCCFVSKTFGMFSKNWSAPFVILRLMNLIFVANLRNRTPLQSLNDDFCLLFRSPNSAFSYKKVFSQTVRILALIQISLSGVQYIFWSEFVPSKDTFSNLCSVLNRNTLFDSNALIKLNNIAL